MTLNTALLASNALLFFLSAAAVVASVAVFLLTGANDRAKDRELEQYKAAAAERTAQLESIAADTRERAASLETEAASLKVTLARLTQPRLISHDAAKRIYDAVAKYEGVTFDVAANSDKEALQLVRSIGATLQNSGWKQLDWTPGTTFDSFRPLIGAGVVEVGISVQYPQFQRPKLEAACQALGDALNKEGLASRVEYSPVSIPTANQSIHIIVGTRN